MSKEAGTHNSLRHFMEKADYEGGVLEYICNYGYETARVSGEMAELAPLIKAVQDAWERLSTALDERGAYE